MLSVGGQCTDVFGDVSCVKVVGICYDQRKNVLVMDLEGQCFGY